MSAKHGDDKRPKLVTTSEFARTFGYNAKSITRWVAEQKLVPDFVTPGGHMRWDLDRLSREFGVQGELPEKLVSTAKFAKESGFGASSIRRWVAQKKLVPDLVTPNGHFRWRPGRLDREFIPPGVRARLDL